MSKEKDTKNFNQLSDLSNLFTEEELVDKKKLHFFISAGTEYIRQYPDFKWICFNILSIILDDEKKPAFFLIEDVYT